MYKCCMLISCLALGACSSDTDGPSVDTSKPNIGIVGKLGTLTLDLKELDASKVQGEREYRGPMADGTDPVDEVPDFSKSKLCELEIGATLMIDEVEWTFELELLNFDPASFGEGSYTVIDPTEATGPGKVSVEVQMESTEATLEKTALSGQLEIKVYNSTGGHTENDDIEEGGYIGGTYDLTLGPEESIKGSFYVKFGDVDVKGKDC